MASIILVLLAFQWILGLCEIYAEFRSRKKNKKRYYDFREILSNLCANNLNLFRLLLVIPAFIFYRYLFSISKPLHLSWPNSSVLSWCMAFVIADFVFYLFHVLSHRWNILWGAHLVHHQPEHWNLSVGGRDSIFGRSILFFMGAPLALTGLPPTIYFSAAFVGIAYMGWTHTRLVGRLGVLEYFLSTPYNHKIHHYKDVARTGGSKNFGGVFIIWDRLFGTFLEEKDVAFGDYEFGIQGTSPTDSPILSQTFFYRHLFKMFFKIPVKDRFKLLFSHYLPEPVPPVTPEVPSSMRTFSCLDWFFCFLLLLLIYQGTSILVLVPAFHFSEDAFDQTLLLKLGVACAATLLAIFQISKLLHAGERISLRSRVGLLVTVVVIAIAFGYLNQQIPNAQKKTALEYVLGSRAFLALGALIAMR